MPFLVNSQEVSRAPCSKGLVSLEYTVTLLVTDNSSTMYSKSIIVTIASGFEDEGLEEKWIVLPFDFIFIIIGIVIASLVCLALLLRRRIGLYSLKRTNRKIDKLKKKLTK